MLGPKGLAIRTSDNSVLILESLIDRWQAHWPNVVIERCRSVHLHYRYVVVVEVAAEARMDSYLGDIEIDRPGLLFC